MAANEYSTMITRLVSELGSGLAASYAALTVQAGLFRPASFPEFTRYAVIVSPTARPWDEHRHSVGAIQYIFRADLTALVKNWDASSDSLFGTTAGALGVFELAKDIKELLRVSDLSGLLDKTYDEPGGDSRRLGPGGMEFEDLIQGFDSGEHAFVHRIRIPYLARTRSFCHAR